jgi:hypothetical protein
VREDFIIGGGEEWEAVEDGIISVELGDDDGGWSPFVAQSHFEFAFCAMVEHELTRVFKPVHHIAKAGSHGEGNPKELRQEALLDSFGDFLDSLRG